jgi:hypothetical protein
MAGSALAQDASQPPASSSPSTSTAKNQAATVKFVAGAVTLYDAAKSPRAAEVGGILSEGDSIVTGSDGELHLDMQDGGFISVRPNTKMNIAKYQANGEPTDTGVFGILEGSFRSITGWIGKYSKDRYQVRTKTATIGIRGTDHEPLVLAAGSADGEPGLYDKVNEGATFIKTPQGRVDIGRGQAGFAGLDKKVRPRVLKDVPRFFRPGRNDKLFEGRYRQIQDALEKRREERRGFLKQKLKDGKVETPKGARPWAEQEARKKAAEARAKRDNEQNGKRDNDKPKTLRERAQERWTERDDTGGKSKAERFKESHDDRESRRDRRD